MKTLATALIAAAAVMLLASCSYNGQFSDGRYSYSDASARRGYDCRYYNYDGRYCDGFH